MLAPTSALNFPPWRAPMVAIAASFSGGILLDRFFSANPFLSSLLGLAAIILWTLVSPKKMAPFFLWAGICGLGAAYHHLRVYSVPASDVRHLASDTPMLVQVRGFVASEPNERKAAAKSPLRTQQDEPTLRFQLRAESLDLRDGRHAVTGLIQVTVRERWPKLRAGDRVEAKGYLDLPEPASNPGALDYAGWMRDQGIGCLLQVAPDQLQILEASWPTSPEGWLAAIRAWGHRALEQRLPASQVELASALLLGEGSQLSGDAWEKYMHTGVVHALAISGQHLVVLAAFLGLALRLTPLRHRYTALILAGLLFGYSLLAGGRPPVMRAAWTVLAWCGAVWLARPLLPANLLALAWMAVLLCNPSDIDNTGCLLSFLAVAILYLGWNHLPTEPRDPIEQMIEAERPWIVRVVSHALEWLVQLYAVNTLIWLALTPLIVERYHVVSPIAILIGPWIVLFASFALLSGFGLLLLDPILGVFSAPFAWITSLSLSGCGGIVDLALRIPGNHFFWNDLPIWWLCVFYGGLIAALMIPTLRQRKVALLGVGWIAILLVVESGLFRTKTFRCTFLAVGHGGCVVLETPGGETILYDAGTLSGPDVTRRIIAPYLWHRGIRRLDAVILSHSDLDHFNGLPQLLDRFRVTKVIANPSFEERATPAVAFTRSALAERGLAIETVSRGDAWSDSGLSLRVLHPPAAGPPGKENARSLVLLLEYRGRSLLLTGDLEEPGLSVLLAQPAPRIDVLMAPHHGSLLSNVPRLVDWAKPGLAIASQGRVTSARGNPYEPRGIPYLATWPDGAVILEERGKQLLVESFVTHKTMQLGLK